jgi:hypothetical protein
MAAPPRDFIDFYEVLEISPNANSGTIERMFHYFAQLYHPDNRLTSSWKLTARSQIRSDEPTMTYDTRRVPKCVGSLRRKRVITLASK